MPEIRLSDRRRQVLAAVADRVPGSRGADCVRVAVDGVDGAGKTVFADQLAAQLRSGGRPVVRVSEDDFHAVRAVRHRRGRDSPEGFWLDSYDDAALVSRVLEPLGPGGSRRYRPASHDLVSDRLLDPPVQEAPPGAVLVLDGLFLHRQALVDAWDLSVFLAVPFEVSVPRTAARDGSSPDPGSPSVARYVQGQRLYVAACAPQERAHLVVDLSDLDAPVLLRGC